jgi:hypothetical protein
MRKEAKKCYTSQIISLICGLQDVLIQVCKVECTWDFAGTFRFMLSWGDQIVYSLFFLTFGPNRRISKKGSLILEQGLVTAKIYLMIKTKSTNVIN